MVEFIIDPEFRDKIPAMPQEDFDGLRADIIRDGYVRDPLVVWKEENILLDGHHRWRVINENKETLGDKFRVDYKSFPDRWAAIAWICANQLHKHNLSGNQRAKLIQEEHDARVQSVSNPLGTNQYTKKDDDHFGHRAKKQSTRSEIAKEHGVGEGSVQRAIEFGRGLDRAAEVDPSIKNDVLSGKVKAPRNQIAEIRLIENDEEVKEAVEVIRDPSKKRDGKWATRETRDRYAKIRDIAEQMGTEQRGTTFDDVLRLLEAAENDFISKVERMIESEKNNITADDRWPDALEGYFDSVISDINELKERIMK